MTAQCPDCNRCFQVIDVDGVMSERRLIHEVLEESRENEQLREEIDRLRNENEAVNERLMDAERELGAKSEPDDYYTR